MARAALPRSATTAQAAQGAQIPDGVTAGIAVFDRRTGTFTEQVDESARFRSASVVKLLLALDFLWDRGPAHTIPEADRARLEPMLRGSDDKAAHHYWSEYGGSAITDRMSTRLGPRDTAPPPAGYEGYRGYTALSARDTVAIYRYILDDAPAPARDFIMDNLRRSTRCASDRFDQHFGIAGSFDRPWAVKQGWSGGTRRGRAAPRERRLRQKGPPLPPMPPPAWTPPARHCTPPARWARTTAPSWPY